MKSFRNDMADYGKEKILLKGTMIGEIYEVIRLLGQSVLNDAYLVRNTVTGKRYVLKLLLSELTWEDNFEEYFDDLHKNIGDFIHPNIVGIYKVGSTEEEYYIVSSYVTALGGASRTLQDQLSRHGRMHEFQAKNVFLQICSGLQHAALNVKTPMSHWDLKPSNILFDSSHLIRICDFSKLRFIPDGYLRKVIANSGFDKQILMNMGFPSRLLPGFGTDADDTESTSKIDMQEYSMVGGQERHERKKIVEELRQEEGAPRLERILNPRFRALAETFMYMSPEQHAGHAPDQRSNIYTLGIIMYETLTGNRFNQASLKMPSHSGCHPCWDEIIKKCIEPVPEKRFATLAALQHEIIQGKVHRQKLLPPIIYGGIVVLVGIMLYLGLHWVYVPYNFAKQVESLNRAIVDKNLDVSNKYAVLELKANQPGATVEIFHKNNLVKKIQALPDSGMRYILPPGDYIINAWKSGYALVKDSVKLSPGTFQVSLKFNKDEPFSVKQYIYRKNQAKPEFGIPYFLPRLNLELLPINPGKFVMGMGKELIMPELNEQLARHVSIDYYFWIGKVEISQNIYEAIMMENPSAYEAIGGNRPVEKVSWNKAMEFCRRLNEQEKGSGRIPAGYEYRLPTEAEWEYCCRAETITQYYFGIDDKVTGNYAWCHENSNNETHDVATRKPNRWGIYDMTGNVAEWAWNSYNNNSKEKSPKADNKKVIAILRGGSWKDNPPRLRSAVRDPVESLDFADNHTGIRIVLAPFLKDLH